MSINTTTTSSDEVIVEDPNGRYQRQALIGRGAFKTVYRALDTEEGLEVAWNQVSLHGVQSQQKVKIFAEISILESVKHPNIMDIYNFWETKNGEHIVFITELCSSGTLKEFLSKVKKVKLRSVKKWAKQILSGLEYLHSRNPPVIHRDLKCDNIFMNANRGEVKIGDLGLSICMKDKKFAVSVIGTPEFMAPELYKEKYDEKVDIYAFGMVMLEMVTGDYPYCECENAAQIFMKVINGIKPASLRLIQLQSVKDFIEMCLDAKEKRPSAKELMQHPFLQPSADDDVTFFFAGETIVDPSLEPSSTLTVPQVQLPVATPKSADSDNAPTPKVSAAHIDTPRVVLQGEGPSAEGTVQMKLYLKIRGAYKEIKFPFNLMEDTAADVATEMVSELELADTASYIDLITKGISDVLADQSLKAHKVKKQAIPLEIDPSVLPDEQEKKPQEKITHEPPKSIDPSKVVASPVKQPATNTSPSDHEPTKDTVHPSSPDAKKIPQPIVDTEPPQQKKDLVVIELPQQQQTHVEEKPITEKPIVEKPASPEVKNVSVPVETKPVEPATKPTFITAQPTPIQIPPTAVTTPVHTSPTEKEKPIIAPSTTSNLSTEEIEVLYNFMREKQIKEERDLREKHKREREEFNKKHGVSIAVDSVWPIAKQETLVSSPVTVNANPIPLQQTTTLQQQQAAASVTQQNSTTTPTKQEQATVKPALFEKQPLSVDTNLVSKTDVAKPETTPRTTSTPNEAKPPLAKLVTNTSTPVAATNTTTPLQQNGTAAKPTTPASTLQAQQTQQKPASVGKPTATVPVPPPLKSNDAIANDLMNDMISKNLGGLDSLLGKPSVAPATAQQQNSTQQQAKSQQAAASTTPAPANSTLAPQQQQQHTSVMPPKSTSLTSAINPAALLKAANANPTVAQSLLKQAPLLELNEHTAS